MQPVPFVACVSVAARPTRDDLESIGQETRRSHRERLKDEASCDPADLSFGQFFAASETKERASALERLGARCLSVQYTFSSVPIRFSYQEPTPKAYATSVTGSSVASQTPEV